MSDLLNSASLVMIPSGYKEDVVYSQIPTDGSGDLSFTRASNGTRVNSAGLVEVCPWNLTDYSEDFSNGFWTKSNTTITTNATIAPNGTTTADKVISSAVNDEHLVYYFESQYFNQVVTLSAYVKKSDYRYAILRSYTNSSYRISVFDLDNGVIASQDLGTSTIESIGNGWYRISTTFTTPSSTFAYQYAFSATQTFSYLGDGTSGNFLWGAQLNIGSTAKPYFPTTDRLNVPRLTYQNGGGGCPSLLLEKQSTNYLIYNTEIDNAAWVKARSTVTANATISPDGTQNADGVFVNSDTNTNHEVFQYGTGATEGWSAFFKANGYNFVYMFGSADPVIWFDLQNGVVGTQQSGVTGKITNYGNGWYRCEYYKNSGTNSIWGLGVVPSNGVTTIASPDTSKGVYFWGAQAEAGLYATSMIYTTSSSATRVADECYKTGISSLIGQTEGVVFAEFNMMSNANSGAYQTIVNIATDANNSIDILKNNTTSELYVFAINGGVIQVNSVGISGTNILGRHKVALAYKANDYVCYLDGVQVFTDTSATVPACSNLYLGAYLGSSNILAGAISQAVLFKTRLTNAELASLTTI